MRSKELIWVGVLPAILVLLASSSASQGKGSKNVRLEGLRSADEVTRRATAETMLNIAQKEDLEKILPTLLIALKDSEADVRLCAAVMLGAVAYTGESNAKALIKAVPALIERLSDPDSQVKEAAANAIAVVVPHPPEIAAAPLISTLNDPEPKVRKAALGALSRVAPVKPEMVSAVVAVLKKDESAQVKGTAAAVLGDFRASDPAAVEALREALHNPDSYVRQEAIHAVPKIGGTASTSLLPELQGVLADIEEDPVVLESAGYAVMSITGVSVKPGGITLPKIPQEKIGLLPLPEKPHELPKPKPPKPDSEKPPEQIVLIFRH